MAIDDWGVGLRTFLVTVSELLLITARNGPCPREKDLQYRSTPSLNTTSQRRELLQLLPRCFDLNRIDLMRQDQPTHRTLTKEMAVQRIPSLVCSSNRPI